MLGYIQSLVKHGSALIKAEYFGHVLLATPVAKGADPLMTATTDSIRQFIFGSLREMNYETDDIDNDTQLGPRGADLASLALVELALRVEDEFGVKFSEEEAEELAGKTVGEFSAIVAERVPAGATVEDAVDTA